MGTPLSHALHASTSIGTGTAVPLNDGHVARSNDETGCTVPGADRHRIEEDKSKATNSCQPKTALRDGSWYIGRSGREATGRGIFMHRRRLGLSFYF